MYYFLPTAGRTPRAGLLLLLGTVLFTLAGCYTSSTLTREQLPPLGEDSLEVIQVELTGGDVIDMAESSATALTSTGVQHLLRETGDSTKFIPYTRIRSVTVRQYNPLLTGLTVGGALLALGGVVFVIVMATSRWAP